MFDLNSNCFIHTKHDRILLKFFGIEMHNFIYDEVVTGFCA